MSTRIIKNIAEVVAILVVVGAIAFGGFKVINAIMAKTAAPAPRTIEDITGISFDDIDHIETTKTINNKFDPNEFRRLYRSGEYEPFASELSVKKGYTYRCYDANNNLILTLTDYPKDSVIELSAKGEISLYKKFVPPPETSSVDARISH